MPVQLWDLVQDPLDVDKKKNRFRSRDKHDEGYQTIKETENEEDMDDSESDAATFTPAD